VERGTSRANSASSTTPSAGDQQIQDEEINFFLTQRSTIAGAAASAPADDGDKPLAGGAARRWSMGSPVLDAL
jgi:hypothetical protein